MFFFPIADIALQWYPCYTLGTGVCFGFSFFNFETVSHDVAQSNPKLVILLPQPLSC
jgi:hypothetical protein